VTDHTTCQSLGHLNEMIFLLYSAPSAFKHGARDGSVARMGKSEEGMR